MPLDASKIEFGPLRFDLSIRSQKSATAIAVGSLLARDDCSFLVFILKLHVQPANTSSILPNYSTLLSCRLEFDWDESLV